jgi:hypothetical protein
MQAGQGPQSAWQLVQLSDLEQMESPQVSPPHWQSVSALF